MSEQWRPIPGYESLYEVSDAGRVRSLDRLVPWSMSARPRAIRGRMLTPQMSNGYLRVDLCRDGGIRRVSIHRLVLLAFVGPPSPDAVACHNNGVRSDNRLSNLRWDTNSGNQRDSLRHGTHFNASKQRCPRGHRYTPENTIRNSPAGARACRKCLDEPSIKERRREAVRRYRARKKGAA